MEKNIWSSILQINFRNSVRLHFGTVMRCHFLAPCVGWFWSVPLESVLFLLFCGPYVEKIMKLKGNIFADPPPHIFSICDECLVNFYAEIKGFHHFMSDECAFRASVHPRWNFPYVLVGQYLAYDCVFSRLGLRQRDMATVACENTWKMTHTHIYIYTHIFTYIHIHTFIHTYTHTEVRT